jgi:glucosamine-phosphate N-acetyltransferase
MNYRLLTKNDFNKGFLKLLEQLTTVGEISKNDLTKRFFEILKNKNHIVYVLEQNKKIVSCATLFIEPKFIHECGLVGHIEDVVVDKMCRGQNLGKKIIKFLTSEAERLGCYKIILDCSEKNVGFYEKCEYIKKGAYMAKYLNPQKIEPISSITEKIFPFCVGFVAGVGIMTGGYYIYKKYWKES